MSKVFTTEILLASRPGDVRIGSLSYRRVTAKTYPCGLAITPSLDVEGLYSVTHLNTGHAVLYDLSANQAESAIAYLAAQKDDWGTVTKKNSMQFFDLIKACEKSICP